MTKEEYITEYCIRSEIDESDFHALFVVMPCSCGYSKCQGWAAVSNNPRAIKSHKDLYQGEL